MGTLEWDKALQERKRELANSPPDVRARNLAAACRGAGLLSACSEADVERFGLETIDKRGYIEPFRLLEQFHQVLSFDIEGDFYEPGSYARILTALFRITEGEVIPSSLTDDVDDRERRLGVSFEWSGHPFSVTMRPQEPTDGFDERIVDHINRFLVTQSVIKQFLQVFAAEMDQILHWIFIDPGHRHALQSKNLLIFDERVPYTERALHFLW
jgi:hypothetical protein